MNFSKSVKLPQKKNRRMSLLDLDQLKSVNLRQDDDLNTEAICKILKVKSGAQEELNNVHLYDFDVFKVKE